MSWIKEFADSFSGKSAKNAIREGTQNQLAAAGRVRDEQVGATRAAGAEARGYLKPFAEQGARGYNLYTDTLGVNGADARSRAQDLYNADDMLAKNRAYDLKRAGWAANASGGFNSGTAALADSRIRAQGYGGWQDRLAGLGAQGFQGANALAGVAQNEGNALNAAYGGYGAAAGNAYGAQTQGMAQAGNAFAQNILGVTGLGIQGFTPGKDGNTPLGNFGSAIGKGANFLGGLLL